MSFQTLAFLGFVIAVAAVCGIVGRRSAAMGKGVLAAACLLFYLSGISRPVAGFCVLLAGMAVTLAASYAMAGQHRKRAFLAAAGWHIAVLLVFKYTGFFTGGAVRIGWAPVGLSFFTSSNCGI